jgi:hypothetical protein
MTKTERLILIQRQTQRQRTKTNTNTKMEGKVFEGKVFERMGQRHLIPVSSSSLCSACGEEGGEILSEICREN